MHFGYSFVVGFTMIYHSGILRRSFEKNETRKSIFWKCFYGSIAVTYPLTILLAIVATANHYWLDAIVAIFVCFLAYLCNRIFLKLLAVEDLLLWALRLEKPTPSTGERSRKNRS